MKTENQEYSFKLIHQQKKWWKKILPVQAPYHWNLRRCIQGKTLEIGCGIGRLLQADPENIIGVDHNLNSVKYCQSTGLKAHTVDDFRQKYTQEFFDNILLSHVAEHMTKQECVELIIEYLPYMKKKCSLLIITPQEKGYASDSTHKMYMGFLELNEIQSSLGFKEIKSFSFPFPRFMGKYFIYNEFVSLGVRE